MLRLKYSLTITIQVILIIVILTTITPITESANVTSFCKCVCAENSTIQALEPEKFCLDCNKAFCIGIMGNNCTGANSSLEDSGNGNSKWKEGCEIELTATCRDSYKDEVIVYFYIFLTSGLLIAAIAKPFLEKWWKKTNNQHFYTSMPNS
ncbi:2853_t:CDS:2 [Diversispora eburnea]|uniref:2853_t:CDS:1 n=1 Tax=Diversispora eburnea TaxID=1213867 RepID=A0A9N8ZVQ1_9GLOM|nr:2853_t:CDS:2 [Diversispora eburnea]